MCALYYNLDPDWVTLFKRFRVKKVRPSLLKNRSNSISLAGHVLQLCSPGLKVYTKLYFFSFLEEDDEEEAVKFQLDTEI